MDVISVPASTLAMILRLALATGLGAAVGINREMRLKPAGLRTHALVALGSALLAFIGLSMVPTAGLANRVFMDLTATSRILQGIIAGVGFIGGGVILRRDDNRGVHGLSTAASIWVVAAIGIATGLGLWRAAVTSVTLALAILALGTPLDRKLREWRKDHPEARA
jgi:putative Mg2+ transporter-C (MgtC) family protein